MKIGRKIISLLSMLAMLLSVIPLSLPAYAEKWGYYTYTVSDNEVTITDIDTSVSGDFTVPAKLGGYPVTGIGYCAFSYCTDLTSVVIPKGVTNIGFQAFSNCTGLTSVTIPEGVTYIEGQTFEKCTSLTGITIPASVTGIGNYAFSGCKKLESITFAEGLVSIGNSAFSGCTSLTDITLPDSVTSIGNYAFSECKNLASVKLSESLISIGSSAFYSCGSLTSITIPDSVTSIGTDAFYWCENLTSITIPASVTTIGKGAFDSISKLTGIWVDKKNAYYTSDGYGVLFDKDKSTLLKAPCAITGAYIIPDEVTNIDNKAFEKCPKLTGITFPENLVSIGDYAFYACAGLTSVEIPEGVTGIGKCAFEFCVGLTDVMLPASLTTIGARAFYCCYELTGITIPDRVTSIEYGAFYFCDSLTSITIPEGVTDIGVGAFTGCTSLTSITISDSVSSIGEDAFYYCDGLETVYYGGTEEQWNAITIGSDNDSLLDANIIFVECEHVGSYVDNGDGTHDSVCTKCSEVITDNEAHNFVNGICVCGNSLYTYTVTDGKVTITDVDTAISGDITIPSTLGGYPVTAIGNSAFRNCDNLTSITLPEGVTSIGDDTFRYCTSLASITLPEGVTSIGDGAFYDCSGLTSITLPGRVTTIGDYAFYKCKVLNSITIPESVTSIGDGTFRYCTSLASITLPEGVTSIGDCAFELCGSLTSITLPKGLTSIGDYAFRYCNNLTSITLPEGVTSIGDCAFGLCESLTSITLPEGVTSIGSKAFNYCDSLETVYYGGTQAQWEAIIIGEGNDDLLNANIIFAKCDHTGTYTDNGDGTHDYVCAECGEFIADNETHSYINGVCACGAEEPVARLDIRGVSQAKNLSLDGAILVKPTIAFTNSEKTANALTREQGMTGKLLFWSEADMPASYENATIDNATSVADLEDAGTRTKDGLVILLYSAYSHGIPAKEYNDKIYYRTYVEVDGEIYYGDVIEYSVVTYCESKFNSTTVANVKLKPLLAAMLNFGAAAQDYFNYKEDTPCNACLQTYVDAGKLDATHLTMNWSEDLLTETVAPTELMAANFAAKNAKRQATNLSLEGAVEAKLTFSYGTDDGKGDKLPTGGKASFYFWTADDYTKIKSSGKKLTRANASYILSDDAVTENYNSTRGYLYIVNSEGIPAKLLGQTLYTAAVFKMADGTEYCSGVTVYSPEAYASKQYNKGNELATLVKWMVLYGEAAEAYFG